MNGESLDSCVVLSQDPTLITRSVEMTEENKSRFDVQQVSCIVRDTLDKNIGNKPYDHDQVNRWSATIVDHTLTGLGGIEKPFKYVVHAVLMQKNGIGAHTASSCLWDNTKDGSCTVRWENKYVYAIVSVFGLYNP
ncbi:unnamed protein product [Adineta ricciae]|uniref:Uncharacterized protein n=1 Tax=Adineta ricciae TaxID=249248 RepID=A0A813VWG4_ADIRI|nr:unnamed protein product [Adineta ricciae]CAF0952467.1 unnamed protein product [Adineta ricciae]